MSKIFALPFENFFCDVQHICLQIHLPYCVKTIRRTFPSLLMFFDAVTFFVLFKFVRLRAFPVLIMDRKFWKGRKAAKEILLNKYLIYLSRFPEKITNLRFFSSQMVCKTEVLPFFMYHEHFGIGQNNPTPNFNKRSHKFLIFDSYHFGSR